MITAARRPTESTRGQPRVGTYTVAAVTGLIMLLTSAACATPAVDGNPAPSPAPAASAPTSPSPSPSADLAGSYVIDSASNPDGSGSYTGQVAVTRDGQLHRLSWAIPNTPPQRGVALLEGNTLAVGYGTQSRYGVAVYRISGGTLTGRWTYGSTTGGAPGTETLVGPAGLNGQYDATGVQPDGQAYTGTTQIVPAGATYTVTRTVAGSTFTGVGIRDGDLMVVGWTEGGDGGVVRYTVDGAMLRGQWATPGSTALGTEVLRRR